MTRESDGWDDLAAQGNGILGQHLKCAKGSWLLDDKGIETGPDGVRIVVIMDTAEAGEILWADQKIVEKNIGRIADGFKPSRTVPEGHNPYTSVCGVRADEGHAGSLVTFTSSSWGGRYAFQNLERDYFIMKHILRS